MLLEGLLRAAPQLEVLYKGRLLLLYALIISLPCLVLLLIEAGQEV